MYYVTGNTSIFGSTIYFNFLFSFILRNNSCNSYYFCCWKYTLLELFCQKESWSVDESLRDNVSPQISVYQPAHISVTNGIIFTKTIYLSLMGCSHGGDWHG